MDKKERKELLTDFLWMIIVSVALILALGTFSLEAYNRGFSEGQIQGLTTGAELAPLMLQNNLESCREERYSCQEREEKTSSELQNCTDKLSKARDILGRSMVACVKNEEALANYSDYQKNSFPMGCKEYAVVKEEIMRD